MPAPPMPRRPRPLTPAPPARRAAVIIPAAARPAARRSLARTVLLARGAEQHPAQRHHPLLQHGDLLPLRGHRPGQRRVLRRQPRRLSFPELRPGTPQRRRIGGRPGASWRDHRAKAAPPPRFVSSTAAPRVASGISGTGSPNTYIVMNIAIRQSLADHGHRETRPSPPVGVSPALLSVRQVMVRTKPLSGFGGDIGRDERRSTSRAGQRWISAVRHGVA